MAIRELPRYYRDTEDLKVICQQLKFISCPSCHCTGSLILHGFHTGYVDTTTPSIRGRRIICNKRRSRHKGCGKSHTIFLSNVLRYCTASACLIGKFLDNVASGRRRIKAFRMELADRFSDSTVFRLFRRFNLCQHAVRAILSTCSQPPASASCVPAIQTIEHLHAVFPSGCAIDAFQYHFQRSFF